MSEREMFWEWAKKENPKLIDEAETGCQFAKDILDYMFMGWVGGANREGYKLVPAEATDSQWAAGIDAYTQAMHGQDILSASAFLISTKP